MISGGWFIEKSGGIRFAESCVAMVLAGGRFSEYCANPVATGRLKKNVASETVFIKNRIIFALVLFLIGGGG